MAPTKTRLLLADDHVLLRSGLRMLLETQGDFEVVGEASDGETAVAMAKERNPDLILMDISMPGMDGMEATRRVKAACPSLKVLVLTMHDDPGYLREVLGAGASGYILKKAADAELVSAIRSVMRGEVFVYPTMTRALVDHYLNTASSPPPESGRSPTEQLSPREQEVLRLVASGYTSREIGDRLGLSAKTVEGYRARLAEKLGAHSRADLIRFALQAGLLDAD
ncbi:MAG: response regulator [Bacillota bacterium]